MLPLVIITRAMSFCWCLKPSSAAVWSLTSVMRALVSASCSFATVQPIMFRDCSVRDAHFYTSQAFREYESSRRSPGTFAELLQFRSKVPAVLARQPQAGSSRSRSSSCSALLPAGLLIYLTLSLLLNDLRS